MSGLFSTVFIYVYFSGGIREVGAGGVYFLQYRACNGDVMRELKSMAGVLYGSVWEVSLAFAHESLFMQSFIYGSIYKIF